MTGKKMSFRVRMILLVFVFMLTVNVALGASLMRQSRKAMKTQINERMLDIVNTAAAMLDGDVLEKLTGEFGSPVVYTDALYEASLGEQINQIQQTIVIFCILSLTIGISVTLFLIGQHERQMNEIKKSLSELNDERND